MDFELRRAREKLEKEQKDRKEKARLRLERERKAKDEAKKQREAIEAAQRSRRLDAIQAQIKADEQMQENLIAGRGIAFSCILEAVPFQGNGDKIKLPSSCFTELSDQGAFDKGPIYFQLSVIHQEGSSEMKTTDSEQKITHSGVLEFTAEEGSVGLPPHVWNNLFPSGPLEVPLVEIRYRWLPKGTYAKLQPEVVGFSDLPNHKAILETTLRQHATLSQGDVITVNHGILTYKLRVLELKPSSSVSVLETDIEVDIVGPDSTSVSETANQHVLKPLTVGTLESGMVEEGNYEYYKFSIDNETWEKIASDDIRVEVKIDAETGSGDTDLYVSKHPLIFPTRHQHEWSSHDMGSKVLILSSKDKNLGVGIYSIGVYGFKGTTKYKALLSVQDNNNLKTGQQAGSSSSMEVDTVECRNCKHFIPNRSIALHEAYCSRHNIVCQHAGCGIVLRTEEAKNHMHCEKCGQAFLKGEMEKHMKIFHEPLQCPCGVVLEKEQMVQHQASACPLRLITCRFCGDMVQAGSSAMDVRDRLRGLSEHESVCGSRTAPCDSCGRSVMLKEMDIHQIAVHQKS
ncbi:uncharacterized protein LOC8276194 [Ricinus communis]|uniref:Ubiquitin fusion degradaton protein, putative n=1 Tax=Ricinus communis TaxID=3988 RepID=B9STM3_RICCO|nr:uncharacterized protein LOC8276194 [Ricinus communis]EEF33059.1 ubiquitin fusion degradaton protein, putative [Ricinus communis]|eukprot:XP_002529342.1 uncharacterized protein LOC8276194 [Ricinus communis]